MFRPLRAFPKTLGFYVRQRDRHGTLNECGPNWNICEELSQCEAQKRRVVKGSRIEEWGLQMLANLTTYEKDAALAFQRGSTVAWHVH